MTVERIDSRLGQLISSHPVDTGRYWTTGGGAAALATGGGLLMTILITTPALVGGRLLAVALLPALAGLPIAVVQLTRAVRTGRDASLELHENGIARRTARDVRGWTWGDITSVVARMDTTHAGRSPTPADRMVESLGWNCSCRIRFRDGARIRFDTYTVDSHLLARAVLCRRPDAARPGVLAMSIWAVALLVVAVGCATALVAMYRYLDSDSADDVGGVAHVLAVLACLVGAVGATTTFGFLLRAIVGKRR